MVVESFRVKQRAILLIEWLFIWFQRPIILSSTGPNMYESIFKIYIQGVLE